jgi:transposase-like protein
MKNVVAVYGRRETKIYSPKFKTKAVATWRDQTKLPKKSQNEVADGLGINHETFRRWCKDSRKGKKTASTQAQVLASEIERLREVVDDLTLTLAKLKQGRR